MIRHKLAEIALRIEAGRDLTYHALRRFLDGEDAVQEVWLLVHRVAKAFDPSRGELLPWLRTVAANRCKELLRAQGRRPDPRVELAEEELLATSDPEDEARTARVRTAVEHFVAGLSAEEALVFRRM